MTASDRARELLAVAVEAADAKQAQDLVALDVSGPLPFADIFLIASGSNERQVLSIASEVEERIRGVYSGPMRREGASEGRWVLLDFGDLVVHVFHAEDRAFYALERLWRDCPVVPLEP